MVAAGWARRREHVQAEAQRGRFCAEIKAHLELESDELAREGLDEDERGGKHGSNLAMCRAAQGASF